MLHTQQCDYYTKSNYSYLKVLQIFWELKEHDLSIKYYKMSQWVSEALALLPVIIIIIFTRRTLNYIPQSRVMCKPIKVWHFSPMLFMIYGVEPIWVFYMIMYTLHLLTYYGFLYACITLLKVALSIEIPWPTMVLLQIVKEHTYIVHFYWQQTLWLL